MASSSRVDAPKRRRVSRESSASTVDFEDIISSSESGEDVDSSDFSTDDEDASSQAATSDRVSTSYGHDSLPASVKRVQFLPRRNPGVEVGGALRSNARRFVRAVDFFQLFFTTQLISMICDYTNKYAWMHILERQTYAERDGSWRNFSPDEVMKCIGILIYMGIVELPRLHLYWNTSELFSGLIPPKIMPRSHFFALKDRLHCPIQCLHREEGSAQLKGTRL
ncbi:piggyBac transposable element-derived protein 4-like [Rhipicephalus sanguineus]|uniref:piggyBac transposable element-derived protein 4-like n=1 Tax=Rhipicephalus sanguineus TaxID=34632 RepID=UPI0020C1C173|nr:piggyBac transposable element-derived protein 4-like [Rhipicephalus sanguineus]